MAATTTARLAPTIAIRNLIPPLQSPSNKATLSARSIEAGNCYTLDGDVSGTELHRLYFPRGGWIDFIGCDLDDDLSGECDDEEGRPWELQGER